ncbi:MAG: pyridoxal-phosphate dependent enzyme [Chitinophagales bacterium]
MRLLKRKTLAQPRGFLIVHPPKKENPNSFLPSPPCKFLIVFLETIGNTPLVRMNKIGKPGIEADVFLKVEYFNPGNSIKDRIGLNMVIEAEEKRISTAGGTIIECTSGNTGMGLALAAAVKGYKCIFTTTDKQSKEKIDVLRAIGAEVIVCPTNVAHEDPRNYHMVARATHKRNSKLSYFINQYENLDNRLAHYKTTGPKFGSKPKEKLPTLLPPLAPEEPFRAQQSI